MTIKRNPDGKLFKMTLELHFECCDEERARAFGNLYAAQATAALRRENSGWIEDTVTLVQATDQLEEITEKQFADALARGSFDFALMARVLGEEKAARFVTEAINRD